MQDTCRYPTASSPSPQDFEFLGRASETTIECIKILGASDDIDSCMQEALGRLGAFLGADRAVVFEIDKARMSNTYEWCASGVSPHREALQNVPLSLIDRWLDQLEANEPVIIENVDEVLVKGSKEEYEFLVSQTIQSLTVVPLAIDAQVIGFLGVDNPQDITRLNTIALQLLSLAHFVSFRLRNERTMRKVEELTWHDPLTGVLSRAAFHRDFDHGVFDDVGFVLVDADRLAEINRTRGRDVGDETLCAIAEIMRDVFGDSVYRIGEDEFCAAVQGVPYREFAELASGVVCELLEADIAASAGSAWQKRCLHIIALLDIAQDRMRQAKRGRHRAADMGVDLASDAAVSNILRPGGAARAVEAGLFEIRLMPQVASDDGRLVGAETLIRYCDRENGTYAMPGSFIPPLEDMNEISCVDFFALKQACKTIVRWQQAGIPAIPLSVNFSRRSVDTQGFAHQVHDVVTSYGLAPSFIEIEVTESARARSDGTLQQVVADLRLRGFRVAIDDFGVENANFSLFLQMDFDVLKLDKTLVWNLGFEERSLRALRGLTSLCTDLNIQSVAEGVETKQQMEALRAAGCSRMQGYFVGKPVPVEEFGWLHMGVQG